MTRAAVVAAALAAVAGCASGLPSGPTPPARTAVLERVIASSVQLRAELDGDGRRSGSGVVVASDPASARSLIATTRHLLHPTRPRSITAIVPGHGRPLPVEIVAVSDELDLAVVAIQGVALRPVAMKDTTRLGEEVWVVGFPWGRRLTAVSGVVSQVASENDTRTEGPARMVDASVSYGTSGAGVFEVSTGALVAIVEGYRTARVALPQSPDSVLHIPVPGETTVVSAAGIRKLLSTATPRLRSP
jgi:S1-C subfamily serine protease